MSRLLRTLMILWGCCLGVSACGYHFQGPVQFAPQLNPLYVEAPSPYGQLAQSLQQSLKVSQMDIAPSAGSARAILRIVRDDTVQQLLSVSSSQQTRQYQLSIVVTYEICNAQGKILVGPETLTESRPLTTQSNQILGSSNEANLFYQQMRRTLAQAIINRIASEDVTALLQRELSLTPQHKAGAVQQ